MFQWIQTKRYVLDACIGAFALLVFGISDFSMQGSNGLIASLLLSASFFFFREYSYSAVILIVLGSLTELLLGLHPTASGFAVALLVSLASALGSRKWSLAILAAGIITGLLVAWNAAFNSSFTSQFYGLTVFNEQGHWWAFGFAAVALVGVNGFAWMLGGFLIEFYRQRNTSRERDIVQQHNLRTALELAEQSQRFLIASDISQTIVQQVSGMLTLTDGARYASRLDVSVAPRTLERLVGLLRESHAELRRLFDMLNHSVMVAAAPPNLNDLELLAVTLREAGYPASIVHQGERLRLTPSVELAIYRIVFDATENVKKHTQVGTSIDINFVWSGHGLQILVKDNGLEVANRSVAEAVESGLEAQEADLLALTQQVTGAGITGLRERAELFGGTVEAHVVPGVGFTVNALFPGVERYRAEASIDG